MEVNKVYKLVDSCTVFLESDITETFGCSSVKV